MSEPLLLAASWLPPAQPADAVNWLSGQEPRTHPGVAGWEKPGGAFKRLRASVAVLLERLRAIFRGSVLRLGGGDRTSAGAMGEPVKTWIAGGPQGEPDSPAPAQVVAQVLEGAVRIGLANAFRDTRHADLQAQLPKLSPGDLALN